MSACVELIGKCPYPGSNQKAVMNKYMELRVEKGQMKAFIVNNFNLISLGTINCPSPDSCEPIGPREWMNHTTILCDSSCNESTTMNGKITFRTRNVMIYEMNKTRKNNDNENRYQNRKKLQLYYSKQKKHVRENNWNS